ncbi:MAG TPA: DUF262 domain-containing protein [Chloroflexia bacterium]|jgi:hypothetical protein
MAYENVTIREIVERCVAHTWSIPEFQRGFVWKGIQVRDLMESLYLNYPIGSLLAWDSRQSVEERSATDAQRPSLWLVDGQQRATALCILFGRKPYWWSIDVWEATRKKYDVRFDIETKEPPYFWIANAAIRKVKEDRFVPLSSLLVLDTKKEADQQTLQELAKRIKYQGLCDGMDAMQVYTRLDRLRQIRDLDIVAITIEHELEEVVEIFARLNSRGTRVTEADIYLGIVATRNPGWVRDTFLPHLKKLAEAGFHLNPNLLFRIVTAVGAKKTRFKEIPDAFWDVKSIVPAWDRSKAALNHLVKNFADYGILSNDPMPTETALITMTALSEKYPKQPFGPLLYWFLQASRFSRYSGSSTTTVDEDLRDINDSVSFHDALSKLLKHFDHSQPIAVEDFMRDYVDSRFGRFLLYMLVYSKGARDWDEHDHRLGFEGHDLLTGFRPQWHHIFPRKFLEERKVTNDKIDALANIAVIGPTINIRISAKNPMDYLVRYKISDEKLAQQFIESDLVTTSVGNYEQWLIGRAQRLAEAANTFLGKLK